MSFDETSEGVWKARRRSNSSNVEMGKDTSDSMSSQSEDHSVLSGEEVYLRDRGQRIPYLITTRVMKIITLMLLIVALATSITALGKPIIGYLLSQECKFIIDYTTDRIKG